MRRKLLLLIMGLVAAACTTGCKHRPLHAEKSGSDLKCSEAVGPTAGLARAVEPSSPNVESAPTVAALAANHLKMVKDSGPADSNRAPTRPSLISTALAPPLPPLPPVPGTVPSSVAAPKNLPAKSAPKENMLPPPQAPKEVTPPKAGAVKKPGAEEIIIISASPAQVAANPSLEHAAVGVTFANATPKLPTAPPSTNLVPPPLANVIPAPATAPTTTITLPSGEKLIELNSKTVTTGAGKTTVTLSGEVQQFRRTWRLRYAPLDAEDAHGGSVCLDGPGLDRLQDGQRIRVTGSHTPAEDRLSTARFQVQTVEVLTP